MRLHHGGAVLLAAALSAGCIFGPSTVTRIVDGRAIEGRAIGATAYAEFTRGVLLEATGQHQAAEAAYLTALAQDPRSAELWARVGAVRCARELGSADQAFAQALELDPELASARLERAQCALARGQALDALPDARRAVASDPQNERASSLLMDALEAAGRVDEALAWSTEACLSRPETVAKWQRVERLARRAGRDAEALHAQRRAALLAERLRDAGGGPGFCDAAVRERLDEALLAGRIDEARQLGARCRVRPGELGLRAAALGSARVAEAQALHVLGAEPANPDAQIAAWVARDLLGKPLLDAQPPGDGEPSPLGARLLAELLARHAGAAASRAWLDAAGPLPPAADALEQAVESRAATSETRGAAVSARPDPAPKPLASPLARPSGARTRW